MAINTNASSSASIMKPSGTSMGSIVQTGSRENRLLFEDEYSREVEEYMHEMEVSGRITTVHSDRTPYLAFYLPVTNRTKH
jgi:hypothetical protein